MTRGPVVGVLCLTASLGAAQDWPQWRGPNRDGVAVGFQAHAGWPRALRRMWQVAAGAGHASPVESDGRVYVFSREGDDEVLVARDLALGREIWRQSQPAPYSVHPAATEHGKGPKATPVAVDGRVFTLGISGTLSAVDAATGRLAWRKEFSKEFRATSPDYGAAASPAVDAGLVLVPVGGRDEGAFAAFDATTGAVRWMTRGDGPAYASPVVATLAGARQIVTQTQSRVVGLAAASGERLWEIPFATAYDQNAVTPVVDGDLVIYSGLEKGVAAVKIVRSGGGFAAQPAWHNTDVSSYLSSPVSSGGRLYGFSHRNKGQFFALDAASGRTLWLSEGRQGESASVVVCGGDVLFLTTEGRLFVVRADAASFSPVATYTVAETPVWAHPALVGSALVVKDSASLVLWRLE